MARPRFGLREAMLVIVILASVLALAHQAAREWSRREALDPRMLPGVRRSGQIILGLAFPWGSTFEQDDPIPLRWLIHNDTDEPVIARSGRANFDLIVRDERGDEAPLTEEGRRRRAVFHDRDRDPDPADRQAELPPGGSAAGSEAAGIGALYDLKPGRYTAVLSYHSEDRFATIDARSEPLRILVTPSTKPPLSGKVLLRLLLEPDKRFVARSSIPFVREIRNDTSSPVAVQLHPARDNLIVLDEQGNEPPLTEWGRRWRAAFEGDEKEMSEERLGAGTLQALLHPRKAAASPSSHHPGISITGSHELKPGRYTARLVHREGPRPSPDDLASEEVPFEVLAALPPEDIAARRKEERFAWRRDPFRDDRRAYNDPHARVRYAIEEDGRHVTATEMMGRVLWRRDPVAERRLPLPSPDESARGAPPFAWFLDEASETRLPDAKALGLKGPVLILSFGRQFGLLDGRTGDFHFCGRD